MSVNNVVLQGRLVAKPEIKKFGENYVMRFRLAVQRNFKNKNGDYDADFITIETWNLNTIKFLKGRIDKGSELIVVGELRITKSGDNYYTSVQANSVNMTTSSAIKQEEKEQKQQKQKQSVDIDDEGLPF